VIPLAGDTSEDLHTSEVSSRLLNMDEPRTEKLSVMLTPTALARLLAYAAEHHWSRSTAGAVLIEQGLGSKEPEQ